MTLGWIWLLACGEKETSDTASNNDTAIEPEETATEVLEDSATETELDTESDQPVSNGWVYLNRQHPSNGV